MSSAATPNSAKGPGALHSIRVLVVDDDSDAREMLEELLGRSGAAVHVAASAAEGFSALHEFHPHVLVSDIEMPQEDGFSFMRRIRSLASTEHGHIPSVAITASPRSDAARMALHAGYTRFLHKPVDIQILTTTVRELAAAGPPEPPNGSRSSE